MQDFAFGFGFDSVFTIAVVLFIVILVAVIGRGLYVWNKNNHSPRLTVDARVVSKRMKVTGFSGDHAGMGSAMHTGGSTRTRYFATFEMRTGERMELQVKDREFGMLAEGDSGKLTYQGSRYIEFRREI